MSAQFSEEEAEMMRQQHARRQAQEEQIEGLMATLLTKEARSRLSNIKIVRPDKAASVEKLILSAAQSRQISAAKPLDENGFVSLLEQIAAAESKRNTIQTRRKKDIDSSDSDDY